MKRIFATLALIAAAGPALACETVTTGPLEVSQAWSRASIGTARPGVVYLTIRNSGTVNGGVKTGHAAAQNQASGGAPSAMARALPK